MPQKKNDPQKESIPTAAEKTQATPSKTSPRKIVNLFMVVVLLVIVGGIYLYQKGYITKYYPLVKTKFNYQSTPLDATVDIPQGATTNFPETLGGITHKASSPDQTLIQDTSSLHAETLNVKNFEKNTLENLQERVQNLEKTVLTLSLSPQGENEGSTAPYSPTDHRLLYALNALQDLQNRLHQGFPFATELVALKTLVSLEDYTRLEEYAPVGIPNLPYLIKHFKSIERLLKQEEAFKNSTTFLERTQAFFGQLIHVEEINSDAQAVKAQSAHDSQRAYSYKQRLRQGDVGSVIEDIDGLQNKNEAVSLWLTHAKAYETVHQIISKTKQTLFQPKL